MPKFLIEREIPGAGELSRHELLAMSQTACDVMRGLGPDVRWVQSFVTGDKFTCVYDAPDADAVREHARLCGFPLHRIAEIMTILDPSVVEPGRAAGA